jgi:hypothetical protein
MRELILFEIRELTLGPDGRTNYRFHGKEMKKLLDSVEALPDIELLAIFMQICRRAFAQH